MAGMDWVFFYVSLVVTQIVLHMVTRPKNKSEATSSAVLMKNFICPYCENVVTGLQQLDRAIHVACIAKSKEDLAAEAEKAKAEKKLKIDNTVDDQYHVTYDHYTSDSYRDGWKYGSYYYHQYVVKVYRNGKEIAKEEIGTNDKDAAKTKANDIITIDKHARAAERQK